MVQATHSTEYVGLVEGSTVTVTGLQIDNVTVEGQDVVGLKDAGDVRIDPATEDSLQALIAAVVGQPDPPPTYEVVGVKDGTNARINPATEETLQALLDAFEAANAGGGADTVALDAATLAALENVVISGAIDFDTSARNFLDSVLDNRTVILDAASLAALENITAAITGSVSVTGTVTVSNFPAEYPLPAAQVAALTPQTNALTDAQLRATPVQITGTVTASGASLNVAEALNFTAHNLQSAALSLTTNLTNDYQADHVELNFSTRALRTITVTTQDGTILRQVANDDSRHIEIDLGKAYFESNEQITLSITQTSTACTVTGKLVVAQGSLSLSGTPSVTSAGFFPVRQWNQFYNIRGQRHIATTGYVQQTLNTSGELIAMFRNPSNSGVYVLFDKAEFGATADCRFSRFAGGTVSVVGGATKRPVGKTDGTASSSVIEVYIAGNSSPQFSVTTPGTLRKVASMNAYRAYQLNDIMGTLILPPGAIAYWTMDEAPGGGGGNFFSYIDFEWVEIPTATFDSIKTALLAKQDF